jgi:4-nitrophenyl phosphatase
LSALEGITAVLVDMDGVLYRGDRPVRGAARAVNKLREMRKKLVFITNNSTASRSAYVRKLKRMGISAKKSEIVTSAYATALHLKKSSPKPCVYVVGERGLKRELREAGLRVVSSIQAEKATHVIAGLDRKLNYMKISAALRALLRGAEFVATNVDATYPTERGLSPGAGATVGALVGCCGRQPRTVVGKPSTPMIKIAMGSVGAKPGKTAIVGDGLDTDIAVGKRLGLRTILVLSGVSAEEDVEAAKGTELAPDFVYRDLKEAVFT